MVRTPISERGRALIRSVELLARLGADDRDAGAALDDVTGLAVERGEQLRGVVAVGEGKVGDLVAEPPDQLGRPALLDDAALVDDRDAVAHVLRLLEVVGAQDDRHAVALSQRADDLPEVAAGDRVEAERRLVEEHHLRVGEQGAGDLQPPAHAAAVGPHDVVGAIGQPDGGEQRGDPPLGVRHAPQARVQPQVLGAAEVVVEHAVLEDDADRAPDLDGSVRTSWPPTAACPLVGRTSVVSTPTVVVLPAPLGPKQAEDLPGPDPEGEAPDGFDRSGIGLGELGDDHRVSISRAAVQGQGRGLHGRAPYEIACKKQVHTSASRLLKLRAGIVEAMKRYGQRCPAAIALDVIGERWTPLIVRELLLGPKRFTDLADGLPGIGTNILTNRLAGLQEQGVVEKRTLPRPTPVAVYELTEAGRALAPVLRELRAWGARFGPAPRRGDAVQPAWIVQSAAGRNPRLGPGRTCELRVGDDSFGLTGTDDGVDVRAGTVGDARGRHDHRAAPLPAPRERQGRPGGRGRADRGRGRPAPGRRGRRDARRIGPLTNQRAARMGL